MNLSQCINKLHKSQSLTCLGVLIDTHLAIKSETKLPKSKFRKVLKLMHDRSFP